MNFDLHIEKLRDYLDEKSIHIFWGRNESELPTTYFGKGKIAKIKEEWCGHINEEHHCKIFPEFLPEFDGYTLESPMSVLRLFSKPTITEVNDNFYLVRIVIVCYGNYEGYFANVSLSKIINTTSYSSREEAGEAMINCRRIPRMIPIPEEYEGKLFKRVGSLVKAAR